MATRTDPDADVDVPDPPIDEDDDDSGDDGAAPWWHSPWRLLVLGVALLFLGGSIGYFVTQRSERHPGAGSVDVGFLQDMRYHHDQATQMSLAYLQKPAAGQDPTLRTIAAEILLGQQLEAGAMVQLLHDYGQPDSNESGIGMAWMSMPVPIASMPGMATPDQIAALKAATGTAADRLFAQLMLDHHLGGVDMAEFAATRVKEKDVRVLAESMVKGQQSDIAELRLILQRLPAA
jgi:uncharacterized protein (DUF305 family)